jgi:hypothetical protein
MQESRPISGQLHIGIKVAPDGSPCVFIEWPDGSGFLLPKGQALCYAFTILAQARNLFTSVEELEAAVVLAKTEMDRIAPIVPKADKDDRPIVQ